MHTKAPSAREGSLLYIASLCMWTLGLKFLLLIHKLINYQCIEQKTQTPNYCLVSL